MTCTGTERKVRAMNNACWDESVDGMNLLNVGNGLDAPANGPDDDSEDVAGGAKRRLTTIRHGGRVKDGQRKGDHPNLDH